MPTNNAITTLDELQAAYPDLCRQLSDQAAPAADQAAAIEQAVSAETERILGLAKIHFGEEGTQKFSGIVSGGITVEQYQAMAAALQPPEASGAGDDPPAAGGQDSSFQQQMLEGINNASAPDVGAGGHASGPQTFLEAVNTIVSERQCSQSQAMSIAAKKHPDLHQAYIDSANAS